MPNLETKDAALEMFCGMITSQQTVSRFLYFLDFAEVLQWCYRCQKLCHGEIWLQITSLRRQHTQHPAAAAGWAMHSFPELWAAKLVTETWRKRRVFPGCIFNDCKTAPQQELICREVMTKKLSDSPWQPTERLPFVVQGGGWGCSPCVLPQLSHCSCWHQSTPRTFYTAITL